MPNLDGTGPMGQGPKTGRGMGDCEGTSNTQQGFGNGQGRRRGGRFSCRRWFRGRGFFSRRNNLASLEEEKKNLSEELENLEEEISSLKKDN